MQLFASTLGHDTNKRRLWQAWQKHRLGDAWIFAGPEGVGKKRTALGLAQRILCEQRSQKPHKSTAQQLNKLPECGQCGECVRIAASTSDAVKLISNPHHIKADEARHLVEFFQYRAQKQIQLAVVDNAHRIHPTAANILLKTLEELPPRAMIILVTSSPFSLLPTVRSRVQTLRFHSLSEAHLTQITGAQDWRLKAARGRAGEIERLNACTELRQQVFNLWADVLQHRRLEPLTAQLKELASSSTICLQAVQFFLQLLRDARVWQIEADHSKILHADQLPLIQQTADLGGKRLNHALQGCVKIEKSILANFERSLSLEMWLRSCIAAR